MHPNKKIYWILLLLTIGSYGWIGYHLIHTESHESSTTLCLFKNVTGIACPSCGVTRSVLTLLDGNILEAAFINPLGLLAMLLLLVIPIWIMADLTLNKTSLLGVYTKSEGFIRKKKFVYIPAFTLIAINWIWNITKGL
jgi:hypothetical protein